MGSLDGSTLIHGLVDLIMAGGVVKTVQSSSHIFVITILQVIIVILFLLFVRYDPATAQRSEASVQDGSQQIRDTYPIFQDVHVMIFIGFGFLMTFLKKYGLSAIS